MSLASPAFAFPSLREPLVLTAARDIAELIEAGQALSRSSAVCSAAATPRGDGRCAMPIRRSSLHRCCGCAGAPDSPPHRQPTTLTKHSR